MGQVIQMGMTSNRFDIIQMDLIQSTELKQQSTECSSIAIKDSNQAAEPCFSNQSEALLKKESSESQNQINASFYLLGEQMQNESELDRNDSEVSFEEEMLQEHIFCCSFLFQKLPLKFHKLFGISSLTYIQEKYLESDGIDLYEYLDCQKLLIGAEAFSLFQQIIDSDNMLRLFLQWVYGAAPQIYLKEVLVAFQKIVVFYSQSFKHLSLSLQQIIQLATRSEFPWLVYGGKGQEVIQSQKYIGQTASTSQERFGEIVSFMKNFTLTVILVIQNFFKNPLFQKIKQAKQRELQLKISLKKKFKSVLSKKIKKNRN